MRLKTPNSKPRKPARRPLTLESLESRLALSGFGMREPERQFGPPCCEFAVGYERQGTLRAAPVGNPLLVVFDRPGELRVNVVLVTRIEMEPRRAPFGDRPAPDRGEGEAPVELPTMDAPISMVNGFPNSLSSVPDASANSVFKPIAEVVAEVPSGATADSATGDRIPVQSISVGSQSPSRIPAPEWSSVTSVASPSEFSESSSTVFVVDGSSIGWSTGWSTGPLTALSLTPGEWWSGTHEDEGVVRRSDPFADGESWWTDEGDADGESGGDSEADSDSASPLGGAASERAAREGVRREAVRRAAVRERLAEGREAGGRESNVGAKKRAPVDAFSRRIARDRSAVDAEGFVTWSPGREAARRTESIRNERMAERAWVRMGTAAARSQSFEVGFVVGSQARGTHSISWSPSAGSTAVPAAAATSAAESGGAAAGESPAESSSNTSGGWWTKLLAGLSVLGVMTSRYARRRAPQPTVRKRGSARDFR